MEDYNNIIEGILYLKGDEGIDIKELSLILEISKKEAVEAMDHFIEAIQKEALMAYKLLILVVNINLQRILNIFLIIKKW